MSEQLKVTGTFIRVLEEESGTTKKGLEWKKQNFILDTGNKYNPEICFQLFGQDKINLLDNIYRQNKIEVFFNVSSKEYNGRYYHSIDAWKIEKIEDKKTESSADILEDKESEDDLPF